MPRFAPQILPRPPEQDRSQCGLNGSKPIRAGSVGGVAGAATDGESAIRFKGGRSGEDQTWEVEAEEGQDIGQVFVDSR